MNARLRFALRAIGALLFASSGLVGCHASPVIRDAREDHGRPIPGETPALKAYLDTAPGPVTIVLVHGVGEHCPYFALDAKNGWLSDEHAKTLGFTGSPAGYPELIYDADNRQNGVVDQNSALFLTRRSFVYHRTSGSDVSVLAAEITWSGLTAWVKDKQLAMDLSRNVPAGALPLQPGQKPPTENVPDPVSIACPGLSDAHYGLSRLMVNRVIKENTLDLSLSDAVLYAGSYGPKIERGVAEVLCRLNSDQTYDPIEHCTWQPPSGPPRRFIFMTHSLGSRIVYDTLLELAGTHLRPGPTPGSHLPIFDSAYAKSALPAVHQMIVQTAAFYMFANQLPLVGLANEAVTARSEEPAKPLIALDPATLPAGSTCADALLCFEKLRSDLVRTTDPSAGTLEIVAFSDPNDLLSYPIPPWYVRDDLEFKTRITNVSIQNDTHWLIFENPIAAHANYFTQKDVWGVMRCGASAGAINCTK